MSFLKRLFGGIFARPKWTPGDPKQVNLGDLAEAAPTEKKGLLPILPRGFSDDLVKQGYLKINEDAEKEVFSAGKEDLIFVFRRPVMRVSVKVLGTKTSLFASRVPLPSELGLSSEGQKITIDGRKKLKEVFAKAQRESKKGGKA